MEVTRRLTPERSCSYCRAMIGQPDARPDDFPATDVSIRAIGERLGRSRSERELTAIASRGDLIRGNLCPRESKAARRRISLVQGRSASPTS